jgi:hypothetical protein
MSKISNKTSLTKEQRDFYNVKGMNLLRKFLAGKRFDIKPKSTRADLPLKMRQYMIRAAEKGLSFTLTTDQFNHLLSLPCAYCASAGGTIDRKDSSGGYILENCNPCCRTCNTMKWALPFDVFVAHIAKVYSVLHSNSKTA